MICNRFRQVHFECPYKDISCNGAVSFWHRRSGLEADVRGQHADDCSEKGLERKQS